MKNLALGAALLASSPALAEEKEPFRYGAGVGFFFGYPAHEHDEHDDEHDHHERELRFAFDAHGDAFASLAKGELFKFQGHFGANIGAVLYAPHLELEVKPLGLHVDCDEGPCKPAYSFESIATVDEVFGIGFVFGLQADSEKTVRLNEFKVPITYKSFFLAPYGHAHPGEPMEFGVQAGFHAQLTDFIGLAPSLSIQKDAAYVSFRVTFGHFHPF